MKNTHNKNGPPTNQEIMIHCTRGAPMLNFPNQDRGPTKWKKWSSIEQAKPPERGKLCLISWKKNTEIQGRNVSSRTYEELNSRGNALNSRSSASNFESTALNSMNSAFNYRGRASNFESRAFNSRGSAPNFKSHAFNSMNSASNSTGNKFNFESNAFDYADSALNSCESGLNMAIENMTIKMKNTVKRNRKTNVH